MKRKKYPLKMSPSKRVSRLSSRERVVVVIPAYKVSKQILGVLTSIPKYVTNIIVIDDGCPEGSGLLVEETVRDRRVVVLFHSKNGGVGSAMKSGYKRALELGADIVVKLDGDGQMDPRNIDDLIRPIKDGAAEYTKGNRFFEIEAVKRMPKKRIFGNLLLSFMTKFSTGYWHIFDPNNGFTAISRSALEKLPLHKIDSRYFFESDMLFRLYLQGCVVRDVPMPAIYGDEKSNLKISRIVFEFPYKHNRNFFKRVIYSYYLKEFNLASLELPLALVLGISGVMRGATAWNLSLETGKTTPAGTVVLTAVLLLSAIQFLLAFLNFDMGNEPKNIRSV